MLLSSPCIELNRMVLPIECVSSILWLRFDIFFIKVCVVRLRESMVAMMFDWFLPMLFLVDRRCAGMIIVMVQVPILELSTLRISC